MTSSLVKVVIVRVRSKAPAEALLKKSITRVRYTNEKASDGPLHCQRKPPGLPIRFLYSGHITPRPHNVSIKYTAYGPHYLHLFPAVAVFASTGLMPRPIGSNITNRDRHQRIGVEADDNGHSQEPATQQRTPLPVKQVIVLCLMRFAEPISFSVIFPFMIEELGVTSDPKELGYYSGLVEGVFALAQFCTVCFWGALSDKIGRRPVLITGLCGVIGSTTMFGLSKSFTTMLISRALSGALNGNVAIIKSVLGEITDETNQGAAFAYLPLCWSMGSLMAPALGGFLSHPAERYPSILGYKLFRQYPYLLPCLVGSTFSAIGLIAGVLFLEESLPKNKLSTSNNLERRPLLASPPQTYSRYPASTNHSVQSSEPPSPDGCGSVASKTEKEAPTVKEMMGIPSIQKILISYGFMAYVTVSINAVLALWLYTPAKSGGVGFSVLNVLAFPVGHALALSGGRKGAYIGVAGVLIVRCIASMVFV
ncbi:unnamed protein product [Rhizoctonia solani]|uniref:Major facilitator superfamily (MFS) profile domain-containing protein n=1 Tax=Rhizoctonia solani TaxID=456999 RepID=A0A8H2X066_9AGAM|nr:unnamed protein product [Rhizoctonia solani]